eukprot:TRINITY_DN20465_c3_g1_i1.p1 TRINITY_DN20465_c3_g1~~TRINITY_DN20465_c3_g1_i1.p1  ORF type:complete len:109 (+),score=8.28 TRINITY_DN20465_c3_g1_i1:1457-1783(+)
MFGGSLFKRKRNEKEIFHLVQQGGRMDHRKPYALPGLCTRWENVSGKTIHFSRIIKPFGNALNTPFLIFIIILALSHQSLVKLIWSTHETSKEQPNPQTLFLIYSSLI